MNHYTLVGVDPGIVHTGVVALTLQPVERRVTVDSRIIYGADINSLVISVRAIAPVWSRMYVEGYRDRGTVNQMNNKMRVFEQEIRREWRKAQILENMGVKKIVTTPMMKAFGVWKMPHTNHRDLQAAARIALFGAIKQKDQPELNRIIYEYLTDYRGGRPWQLDIIR